MEEKILVDKKVYDSLLEFKDKECDPIRKIRYYFVYNGEYFNLDIFEDMNDIGILEVTVREDVDTQVPDYVSVMEFVSNNELYFNRNIAKKNTKRKENKHD